MQRFLEHFENFVDFDVNLLEQKIISKGCQVIEYRSGGLPQARPS